MSSYYIRNHFCLVLSDFGYRGQFSSGQNMLIYGVFPRNKVFCEFARNMALDLSDETDLAVIRRYSTRSNRIIVSFRLLILLHSLCFLVYTLASRLVCIPRRKYKWLVRYSLIYHMKALHRDQFRRVQNSKSPSFS